MKNRFRKNVKILPNKSYSFCFVLSSGDGDDYPECKLHVALWKWDVWVTLPPIVKPDLLEIRGQYNYDEHIERRYGVYLFDNHFNIVYGRGDANFHRDIYGEEQRWSCFLPWNEWRLVRHSLYDLYSKMVWSSDGSWNMVSETGKTKYERLKAAQDAVLKAKFRFRDFDGEGITATTFVEEREWRRGEKWFKWVSWFSAPRVHRVLDLAFDKEVGRKKGSWKGGTVGHSIEVLPNETHCAAFMRYCQEHDLKFVAQIP